MKIENKKRWQYWYYEALRCFNLWAENTANTVAWGAFCCCSACMVEYDKNHAEPETQEIQQLAWNYGWAKGDDTLEAYQNSGYFDEKFYKKITGNA